MVHELDARAHLTLQGHLLRALRVVQLMIQLCVDAAILLHMLRPSGVVRAPGAAVDDRVLLGYCRDAHVIAARVCVVLHGYVRVVVVVEADGELHRVVRARVERYVRVVEHPI